LLDDPATAAPASPKRRAIAAPIPFDAPVTIATFPLSSPIALLLIDFSPGRNWRRETLMSLS